MVAPATTEEEAIAQAKALFAGQTPDSAPVPREAAARQQAIDASDDPLRAKFDSIVSEYSNAPAQPTAPVESPEAAAIAEAKRHGLVPPEASGAPEAPSQPFSLTRLAAPDQYDAATGATGRGQVADADNEAARRAEFNKLNAQQSQQADALLSTPQRSAVIVSPGGMRPSSVTRQVTQGPAVKDADQLLADYQANATKGAEGDAAAGKERDTTIAGLESNFAQGSAKLAGGEQQAAQKQSAALSGVADRMSKALDAARVPVVSPAQELSSMGIGQKLAFALAAAGGGIAGRATGTNPFLQGYNQMVDARIATQKAQAEQSTNYAKGQDNLYSVMKQGFQSDDAARAALRTMYLQALDTKLKEAVTHYNIDAANPHVLQLKAGIDQQLLANQEELAKISGKHFSKEETDRYVPPSAVVVGVGGLDPKKEKDYREKIHKARVEQKIDEDEQTLDTLANIARTADKGNVVSDYLASHPGMSIANATAALLSTPEGRQRMADTESMTKDALGANGLRSELGRQVVQTVSNPVEAVQVYNRYALQYQKKMGEVLTGIGPAQETVPLYRKMRQEGQAIQHMTNSPVRAAGAEPLPEAINKQ
jgi:hypothetical protein